MRRPEWDDFPDWDDDEAPPDSGEPEGLPPLPPLEAYAGDPEAEPGAGGGPTVVNAAAPPGPPEPLFPPVTRWAGKTPPEREWHVAELIPASQVTMLGGEPGSGKSLLAKQLAIATAARLPWVGRAIGRPGPSLYLSAEDSEDELHRRIAAICEAERLDLAQLPGLRARSLADADALLATADRRTGKLVPTELYRRLDVEMGRVRPSFLGLDTLADLHAGDEINRAHARQFVGLLRHLAIKHRCSILLLAHPSLTGINSGSGLSGSTAWGASVRSRIYLERVTEEGIEPDPDVRRLSVKKANYGRTGGEIALRWRDGRFVAEGEAGGLDRMAVQAKAERVFLALLDQFTAEGRHVRVSTGPGYAPHDFSKSGRSEGVSKRELAGAMERLFEQGRIRNAESGPPSRRFRHIERASE